MKNFLFWLRDFIFVVLISYFIIWLPLFILWETNIISDDLWSMIWLFWLPFLLWIISIMYWIYLKVKNKKDLHYILGLCTPLILISIIMWLFLIIIAMSWEM